MVAYSKPRGFLPMLVAIIALLQVTVAFQFPYYSRDEHARPAPRTNEEMAERLKEANALLEKRAGRVKTTGVVGTSGERKEIRDLAKNADQWNLYLLGMEYFQKMDKNNVLSYYSIAGIHGRPYKTWNGFGNLVNQGGFCPHGSTLFISWHRPYLATYEQAWYAAVEAVIKTFPSSQQARWNKAKSGLRIPYWDWAVAPPSGQSPIPTLIRDKFVTVTKPSGKVSIANPLYSYSFGSSLPSEMGGGPSNSWPATLRRPVSNPTRSNNNEVSSMLTSMRTNLRDRLYYIFISKASLGAISTEQIGARTEDASTDSIESLHDAIHTTVGGESGGTMYYLDYSAFDPIFWLHHANIDRIFAMYQLNTPNSYIAAGNINNNMAQWSKGDAKNADSPLKPFVSNAGTGSYYSSNDVKSTQTFGYYYADAQSKSAMISAVNSKYSAGKNGLSKRSAAGKCDGRQPKKGDYHTVLSIVADKYLMDGSYTVYCFLGSHNSTTNGTSPETGPYSNSTDDAPYGYINATGTATGTASFPTGTASPYNGNSTNSTGSIGYDYTQDPNFVGSYGILGMGHSGNMSTSSVSTEGCIPLTSTLQCREAAGYIASTAPNATVEYLKNNLYYKIIGPGGLEYHPSDIPGFHVYVQTAPVTPPAVEGQFPSLGSYQKLPAVTESKPAGQTYTWTPGPYDYVGYNDTDTYEYPPPSGAYPSWVAQPTSTQTITFQKPQSESGYCVNKRTIVYVDEAGTYLYTDYAS